MPSLRIDLNQCIGCRRCEIACSINHSEQAVVNPQKSRIRVFIKEDMIYPMIAGPFNNAECTSKHIIVFEGKQYDGCTLCRATCPLKPWFKEPETGIYLKCDFCGTPPDPNCVKWCPCNAITLVDDKGEIELLTVVPSIEE